MPRRLRRWFQRRIHLGEYPRAGGGNPNDSHAWSGGCERTCTTGLGGTLARAGERDYRLLAKGTQADWLPACLSWVASTCTWVCSSECAPPPRRPRPLSSHERFLPTTLLLAAHYPFIASNLAPAAASLSSLRREIKFCWINVCVFLGIGYIGCGWFRWFIDRGLGIGKLYSLAAALWKRDLLATGAGVIW